MQCVIGFDKLWQTSQIQVEESHQSFSKFAEWRWYEVTTALRSLICVFRWSASIMCNCTIENLFLKFGLSNRVYLGRSMSFVWCKESFMWDTSLSHPFHPRESRNRGSAVNCPLTPLFDAGWSTLAYILRWCQIDNIAFDSPFPSPSLHNPSLSLKLPSAEKKTPHIKETEKYRAKFVTYFRLFILSFFLRYNNCWCKSYQLSQI